MGIHSDGRRVKAIDLIPAERHAWVRDDVGFRRLFEFLDENGPAKVPKQEAAAEMTARGLWSFRRHFQRVAGCPWRAFVPEWKLREAWRLVGNPVVGINEVRVAVGIRSSRTFAREFKRRFGVTPGEARRKALRCFRDQRRLS